MRRALADQWAVLLTAGVLLLAGALALYFTAIRDSSGDISPYAQISVVALIVAVCVLCVSGMWGLVFRLSQPDPSVVAVRDTLATKHRGDVAAFARQMLDANVNPPAEYHDLTPQEEQLREALFRHYPELLTQLGSMAETRKECFLRARMLRYTASDVAKEKGFDEQIALFLAQEGEDIARNGVGVIGVENGLWKVLSEGDSWFYSARQRFYKVGPVADEGIQNRFMNVAGFVDDWAEVQALRDAVVANEQAFKDYRGQLSTIVLTHARSGVCDLCPSRSERGQ